MNDGMKRADEILAIQPEVCVKTSGISMRPMLRQGRDVVVIQRVSEKLKRNDVPLYRRPNCESLVLHRILKVRKDGGYVIRGDNLCTTEYNVTDEDIVGVLKGFYREGKYYDCKTSRIYHIYIFLNRITYPFRYGWRIVIRPFLSRVKQKLLSLLRHF